MDTRILQMEGGREGEGENPAKSWTAIAEAAAERERERTLSVSVLCEGNAERGRVREAFCF